MIESTKRKPRNAEIADKPESYRRSGARDQHLTPEADMSQMSFISRLQTFLPWPRLPAEPPRGKIPGAAPPGRPMSPPPGKPRIRGLSKAARKAVLLEYGQGVRRHFAEIAAFDRERRVSMGLSRYRWSACIPSLCSIAAKNDGKIFSYENPPKEGHPCEGECDADWCRCCAQPIVPDFG